MQFRPFVSTNKQSMCVGSKQITPDALGTQHRARPTLGVHDCCANHLASLPKQEATARQVEDA